MKRYGPNPWSLKQLMEYCRNGPITGSAERGWMPARPLGLDTLSSRLRLAWAVFTGRADALFWEEPTP